MACRRLIAAACWLAAVAAAGVARAEAPPRNAAIYEQVTPDSILSSPLHMASAGALAARNVFLAIPEAPSAALLIIGLAAVGVAARRRSR